MARLLFSIAAIAVVIGGLLWPSHVEAHASYVRSEPAFAAELATAPDRIDLWFSQQLFRRQGANTIRLLDSSGTARLVSEALIDSADRQHLFSSVAEPLPPGRYIVEWTNLSAEDGDADSGRYSFYVLYPPTAADRASDRALAEELLIPYPGDGPGQGQTEATEERTVDALDPVTLPPAVEPDEGGISAGPIALAIVSAVTVAGLAGGRLIKARKDRRS
ncbi:MAG: copper resistance protein CopC [Chloroflexi bacterium]|nr:copper resistance protein CopC [Chloroflexota bacterium]